MYISQARKKTHHLSMVPRLVASSNRRRDLIATSRVKGQLDFFFVPVLEKDYVCGLQKAIIRISYDFDMAASKDFGQLVQAVASPLAFKARPDKKGKEEGKQEGKKEERERRVELHHALQNLITLNVKYRRRATMLTKIISTTIQSRKR